MLLPPKITTPMRVMSINQEYRGPSSFPVWVYALQVDPEQSQRMVRDWDRTAPSEYIVFDEFKFCTETQLPLGVGDLFTPELIPADEVPENEQEAALRHRREMLLNTLRDASPGFFVVHDPDQPPQASAWDDDD